MWIWKLVAHILPMGVTLAETCLHGWQLFVQMALTELCSPFPCYSESTARGSHSGSWPSLFLKSPNIYVFFLGERKPGEIAWKTIYQEELNEMTHQSPADGEDSSVLQTCANTAGSQLGCEDVHASIRMALLGRSTSCVGSSGKAVCSALLVSLVMDVSGA